MPSEPIENYLKHIYEIQESEGRVTTSVLSDRLSVSAPSVTEMLRRLAAEGVVTYTPYRGVELTDQGRRHALRIIRRHRLWELFLVRVLHYRWDEIHDEAERLEHMTSDLLERRIDAALGFPRTDPHGHAIPSRSGVLHDVELLSLAECSVGTTVTVSRVNDQDPAILRYLSRLGIEIGRRITVREQFAFDGSLVVKIDGKERVLTPLLARSVFVRGKTGRKGKTS
jgi:DtxR family Mn-dependent transcriptional regulator